MKRNTSFRNIARAKTRRVCLLCRLTTEGKPFGSAEQLRTIFNNDLEINVSTRLYNSK